MDDKFNYDVLNPTVSSVSNTSLKIYAEREKPKIFIISDDADAAVYNRQQRISRHNSSNDEDQRYCHYRLSVNGINVFLCQSLFLPLV